MLERMLLQISNNNNVPSYRQTEFKAALELLTKRQFNQAREYIDNIQAEFIFTSHTNSLYAALQLIKGCAAFSSHDYKVALENIKTGIRYDENNIDLHIAKVYMHLSLMQYAKMMPSLEQAIALEQTNKDRFLAFRSFMTYQLGDVGESLSSSNQALKLNPDNPKALYYKTKCLLYLGLLNGNIESELTSFIARNINHHENVIGLISARSEVRFKAGNIDEALIDAEYVIKHQSHYLNSNLIPHVKSLLSTDKEGDILENAYFHNLQFKFLIDAIFTQLESYIRLEKYDLIINNHESIKLVLKNYNDYALDVLRLRKKLNCCHEEEFTNDFYIEEQLYISRAFIKHTLLFAEASFELNDLESSSKQIKYIYKIINNIRKMLGITGFYYDGQERLKQLEDQIRLRQNPLRVSNSFADEAISFDSVKDTLFSQPRKQKREDDSENNDRQKRPRKK